MFTTSSHPLHPSSLHCAQADSKEGRKGELALAGSDLGLLRVVFAPEQCMELTAMLLSGAAIAVSAGLSDDVWCDQCPCLDNRLGESVAICREFTATHSYLSSCSNSMVPSQTLIIAPMVNGPIGGNFFLRICPPLTPTQRVSTHVPSALCRQGQL